MTAASRKMFEYYIGGEGPFTYEEVLARQAPLSEEQWQHYEELQAAKEMVAT